LPIISGLPSLTGQNLSTHKQEFDPIASGLSKTMVVVDDIKFAHRKYGANSKNLEKHLKEKYIKAKDSLKSLTWGQANGSYNQGNGKGYRYITKSSIRKTVPDELEKFNIPGFLGFKYYDKKYCFAGICIDEIFYVIWVDQKPNDIYNHG